MEQFVILFYLWPEQLNYLVIAFLLRNYWRDDDTALFILKHLYRDIPEEPELQAGKKSGGQKNGIGSEGWSDQREVAEEELPLTFADKGLTRSFSASARKIMKKR